MTPTSSSNGYPLPTVLWSSGSCGTHLQETWEDGDLLLTGTPAHSRPVNIGDVVEVEISGIGRLTNTVIELDHDLVRVGEQPSVSANTLHVALTISEEQAEIDVVKYK